MPKLTIHSLSDGAGAVRRWAANHHQRRAEWQLLPLYWLVRQRRSMSGFWLVRKQYQAHRWLGNRRDLVGAIGALLRAISVRFILALVVVVGLEVADRLLFSQPRSDARVGVLPNFLQRFWPDLTELRFDTAIVANLLAVFIQVAGVFLGLYFAAVSLVVGTYASSGAPARVLALLVRKLSENGYIGLIAFFGSVSTFLMAEAAIGLNPGMPSLALVTFLGASSIFAFVFLGVRTFAYLSPANLATGLPQDLMHWVGEATPSGGRWLDESFQLFYQQQSEQLFNGFEDILDYSVADRHSSANAISELTSANIRLLQWYSAQKHHIPTNSRWFARLNKFRSWLTVPEQEVMVLLATTWQGGPQAAQDLMWFERRLEAFTEAGLRFLIEGSHLDATARVLEVGQASLQVMSRHYAIAEALSLSSVMDRIAYSTLDSADIAVSDLTRNAPHARGVLALHESGCAALTSIILGFTRAIEATTLDAFHEYIANITWNQPKTLYASPMPRPVIQQVELLAERLGFERDIEDRTITPIWYQEQFVGRAYISFLQVTIADLVTRIQAKFGSGAEGELAEGRYLFALQGVERGLEACTKAAYLIEEAKSCQERMAALRRVPEEPWPESNWDAESERVKELRRRLVQVLGRCMPALMTIERYVDNWPDYFGYAHRIVAQECASAMFSSDDELFGALFPSFFDSCLAAHDRLVRELASASDPVKSVYISEPIADLLHLSGLALIVSELNGTQFWKIARPTWDVYLESGPGRLERMKMFNSVIRYRETLLMVPPYQGIRRQWQIWLERRLREQGILADDFANPVTRHRTPKAMHASPVIRSLANSSWQLRPDPEDVFVVVYLYRLPGGDSLRLTSDQMFFLRNLQQQEAHASSLDDAGGD